MSSVTGWRQSQKMGCSPVLRLKENGRVGKQKWLLKMNYARKEMPAGSPTN